MSRPAAGSPRILRNYYVGFPGSVGVRRPASPSTTALLRGIALAAWAWVVFAAFGAGAFTTGTRPPNTTVPPDFGGAFLAVLTLDLGPSSYYGRPALAVALERVGPTLALLSGAGVVAAVLGSGVVALARRDDAGRRVAAVSGYALGFPAAAWLLVGASALGGAVPLLAGPPAGAAGLLVGAVALALPLVAAVARAATRGWADRGWALDGLLFASWLLSAVVVVESLLGVAGVGRLLYEALAARDLPVSVAAAALLTLPALVAVVAREVAWSRPAATTPDGGGAGDAGRDGVDAGPRRAVRENRRLRLGLVAVGGVVALGVVGVVLRSPAAAPPALPLVLVGTLGTLVEGLVVALVAGLVGVALGWLTSRATAGRAAAAALTGAVAAVPLVVWFVVLRPPGVPRAAFGALAVASPVWLRAARAFDRADGAPVGVVRPAFGVALVGAGVVALVTLHLPTLGVTPARWLVVGSRRGASALALGVAGLAPLSLFLLGEGLRRG